jgi:hypothetical protein
LSSEQPQQANPSLHERQVLLVRCLSKLYDYACQHGYELTLAEGGVQERRRTRDGHLVDDGVHMRASLHYIRLAQDLNLFVNGEWIAAGTHPAWRDLGELWLGLDPLCRWGGNFRSGDACHFSVTYEGRE